MTPEQRRRAGDDIARRIKEMETSAASIARAAGIHPRTLRELIAGRSWPSDDVQRRVEQRLRWQEGEISARAVLGSPGGALAGMADSELAAELLRRCVSREKRDARLRSTD